VHATLYRFPQYHPPTDQPVRSLMVQRAEWVPVLVCLSGVFTMLVIFVAFIQIRAHRPGRYLVVSDSMNSLKTLQTQRVAPRTH
jgi:hypothetical protein